MFLCCIYISNMLGKMQFCNIFLDMAYPSVLICSCIYDMKVSDKHLLYFLIVILSILATFSAIVPPALRECDPSLVIGKPHASKSMVVAVNFTALLMSSFLRHM